MGKKGKTFNVAFRAELTGMVAPSARKLETAERGNYLLAMAREKLARLDMAGTRPEKLSTVRILASRILSIVDAAERCYIASGAIEPEGAGDASTLTALRRACIMAENRAIHAIDRATAGAPVGTYLNLTRGEALRRLWNGDKR